MALKAYLSTSDFHKYDNKDVLGKVVEVRDKYYDDNKQLMINYSLRGESEFSKLYKEKGSYNVNKKQKNNSDCVCTTFIPSHCDYHCADCGVRRG